MPESESAVLPELFHPAIAQWFQDTLGKATAIQLAAWPRIAEQKHVLVSAPTGSGKTLTAFLWAINQLVTEQWSGGAVRVLYVSPLKALNNDIRRNLKRPLKEIAEYCWRHGAPMPTINVMTRSGDTPVNERRKMLSKPPEILVTTPESLNILLTAKSSRDILSGVKTVIIDEIHSVISDKRGVYCLSGIERLSWLSGEFQRIALSATVSPMSHVAEVLGAYRLLDNGSYQARDVEIIEAAIDKKMDVQIQQPIEDPDYSTDDKDAVWRPMIDEYIRHINANRSTLFFAGTRVQAEKVTHFINEQSEKELAYAHHGSLSREIRFEVEQAFKAGLLKAMVATNSLEMGIDIGDLDEVVLINTPLQVNSAIQRIGRAGHGVGEESVGRFMPIHDRDLLTATVMAPMAQERAIESMAAVRGALDVLAQLIICLCNEQSWKQDDLYKAVRCIWSYHDLRRPAFDLVIAMLLGRYADTRIKELKQRLEHNPADETVKTKKGVATVFYSSGGVIPDRGYFKIRLEGSGAIIGELDEEFVWEQDVGTPFVIGTQTWRIKEITENDVIAEPYNGAMAKIPFWRGESDSRSFAFGVALSEFLEEANQRLEDQAWRDRVQEQHRLDDKSIDKLCSYLMRQKRATAHLPHRHLIVVEHCGDKRAHTDAQHIIMHAPFGVRVLRPWALALSGAVADRYQLDLETMVNDDCMLIQLPPDMNIQELLDLVGPDELEYYLRLQLEATPYFGARFRENAARALLLPRQQINKRMPLWLNRLRAKKLFERVSRFRDFPIIAETWRECLQDHFDIPHVQQILRECQQGIIQLHEVPTAKASPFADSLVYRSVDKYMYEDDRPYHSQESQLSTDVLSHVLQEERPPLPKHLIFEFALTLRRSAPDTCPQSEDELLEHLEEFGFMALAYWDELKLAIEQQGEVDCDVLNDVAILADIPGINCSYVILCHHAERLARLTATQFTQWNVRSLNADDILLPSLWQSIEHNKHDVKKADWSALLIEIAQIAGPQSLEALALIWGLDVDVIQGPLDHLREQHQISIIPCPEISAGVFALNEHYERLLRIQQQFQRSEFSHRPLMDLCPLLAHMQGLQRLGRPELADDLSQQTQEDLQFCFEVLFGYSAPVHVWERDILSARIASYHHHQLDVLMSQSDLQWFGTDTQKVAFAFTEQLPLFHRAQKDSQSLRQLFPDSHFVDFHALQQRSKHSSAELTEQLWEMAWNGLIHSDSFAVLRQGLQNQFKAQAIDTKRTSSPRRWQRSAWTSSRPFQFLWKPVPQQAPIAAREALELAKERARQLLNRYGIIFRELLKREQPLLQWRHILPALRIMSLSGEIISGHFLEGINGFQFATQSALEILRERRGHDDVYWMNSLDPASLCGLGVDVLKGVLPNRHSNTYLVFHGPRLVLCLRRGGRSVDFSVDETCEQIAEYCGIFEDLIQRKTDAVNKIVVEEINAVPALKSPYRSQLELLGFESNGKDLLLRKQY